MLEQILSHGELRLFFGLMTSVMCYTSMIINHMTWRKYISLLVLNITRSTLAIIAITISAELSLISTNTSAYVITLIMLIALAITIAYTLAKVGLLISTNANVYYATVSAVVLKLIAAAFRNTIVKHKAAVYIVKFERMAHNANLQRVPVTIRRAHEIRDRINNMGYNQR